MDIFLFLCVTLGVFAIPLVALYFGKEWLIALLPIYLITGNVFAESFILVKGYLTSMAVPIYAATFLITDILSEHYGKTEAKRAVYIGFMGQLFFVGVLFIILNSPLLPDKSEMFHETYSLLPRLIMGSFIAYIISQLLDVYIYHKIMEATGKNRLVWLRNNVGTMTAQLVDTTIFLTIAFYGRPQFDTYSKLIDFILTTWMFKVIVAALDTPYLYLARRFFRGRHAYTS